MTPLRRGDYVHLPGERLGVVLAVELHPVRWRGDGPMRRAALALVEDATRGTRSEHDAAHLRRATLPEVAFRLGPQAVVIGRHAP